MTTSTHEPTELRWATHDDCDEISDLHGRIHGEDDDELWATGPAAWVRDLLDEHHPSCGPGNFIVAVDRSGGRIVSTSCLIPQTWTWRGAPFVVARLECFATDPAWRGMGLVSRQVTELHLRGALVGATMFVISGLSRFYRQFGYDYALEHEGRAATTWPTSSTRTSGDRSVL